MSLIGRKVTCSFQGEGEIIDEHVDMVKVRFHQSIDKNGVVHECPPSECWRTLNPSCTWLTLLPE